MKVFASLLLAYVSLFGVDWLSYSEAKVQQKKSGKIIMIDAVRTSCQYCENMEFEVFDDEAMEKYLSERFIFAKVNLDEETMPLSIKVVITPSFYFIDKNEKIVKKIYGSWNIEDFKDLTKGIK